MKYMFVSDIHGNLENLEKIIEIFEKEEADKLIILGDTSGGYYDDTNYQIATILNDMKKKVEVIRGNCDSAEFEDMLEFEMYDDDILYIKKSAASNMLSDEKSFLDENEAKEEYITISISHGHIYNYLHLPPNCGDIFIQGHTHVPQLFKSGGRILANPGSPTRLRATDLKCYITVDEKEVLLKSFTGEIINKIAL